jgi:hypothetical protein
MSTPNSQAESAASERPSLVFVGVLVSILLAAACVRTLASQGDLWFDEVWTWWLLRGLQSPLDIMVMHHDNNHYLNSFYWYWVGNSPHAFVYRVPSIVLGTATVALGASLAEKRGRLEELIAAALLGSSFLLILYSSEGRGYAAVTFFALAAFAAMRQVIAIGLWTMAELMRPGTRLVDWFLRLLRYHALPGSAISLLNSIDLPTCYLAGAAETQL